MTTPPTVTTIQEINDQYSYEDTTPGGKTDKKWVSCGQDSNYNELKHIFEKHLQPKIDLGLFTKQKALNALNSACFDLSSPRTRTRFETYLETYLDVKIFS
uniref:Uncharacterized protein n=1 Tax=Marinomonas sp. (strain MWYL1) TaxID=400668 RepID=A6VSU5_MARMS